MRNNHNETIRKKTIGDKLKSKRLEIATIFMGISCVAMIATICVLQNHDDSDNAVTCSASTDDNNKNDELVVDSYVSTVTTCSTTGMIETSTTATVYVVDTTSVETTIVPSVEMTTQNKIDPDKIQVISYDEEIDEEINFVEENEEDVIIEDSTYYSLNFISDTDRIMLCNVVAGEYGADWISIYDKACVVACVMNRYYDGGWQGNDRENSIENILTAPYQFDGYYANPSYNDNVTQGCIDAVEYYFTHQEDFPHYISFYGDGIRNYFS